MQLSTAVLMACVAFASAIPLLSREANTTASTGPISGLSTVQTKNAQAIMGEVRSEGLDMQACKTALSAALQESTLLVYANHNVSSSLNYPHDAVGGDQDSIGLYQQRPEFYPNIAADMDPVKSTTQFLTGMKAVPGWETMDVSTLCQTVQKAQAGNRYAKRVDQAITICKTGGFS